MISIFIFILCLINYFIGENGICLENSENVSNSENEEPNVNFENNGIDHSSDGKL